MSSQEIDTGRGGNGILLYTIAHKGMQYIIRCWVLLILPLFIALIQAIALLPRKNFPASISDTILGWIFLPGFNRILTFSIIGLLVGSFLIFGIILLAEEHTKGGKTLRYYLHKVID